MTLTNRAAAPAARASQPRRVSPVAGYAVLLVLLPFLLFWRTWWPDPAQRRVFAYGDFAEQYYPMRAFVTYELRHGRLPLWDPYTYGGQPAAGASLYAPFYPLGLTELLWGDPLPYEALQVEALLHLGLAGVLTFLLVRKLTGRTGAGVIAGLAFSLGGFLTSYPVLQLLIVETAAWLPAILWLLELALERRSAAFAAVAGGALGCALLAGHPQTFLYIAYVTVAFYLWRAWRVRAGLRRTLTLGAVACAIGVGLGAVQWLPTWELSRLSPRANLAYADVAHGFGIAELWGILRPNPGQWSPLYVGIVPLALAVVALLYPAHPVQPVPVDSRPDAWFWAVVAAAGTMIGLGANGFLYPIAHRLLPGFAMFRNQERAAFVVSFALAVLAGYGWSVLQGRLELTTKARRHQEKQRAKESKPLGVFASSWFRKHWYARALPVVILIFTFADLYRANAGLILAQPPAGGYFAMTPAVAQVQSVSLPGWRMSSEGLLPGDGNGGLVFRVRDVAGNSPLHLQPYDQFINTVPEVRWWQLLNVQHILTRRLLDHGALKLVRQDQDSGGVLRLYQVFVHGLPVWISHQYEAVASQAAALQAAARPDLDARGLAVLEGKPGPEPSPAIGPESAELKTFEPGRVAAELRLSAPGLAVFSEIAYPGWTAYVKPLGAPGPEQALPGLRAFGLLRAVALPAGAWHVEWRYEPASVRLGAALSVLALAAVTLAITLRKRLVI